MDKLNSRKYKLAKWIIMISTFLTFIPPIVSVWFLPAPLVILTGTEFVSIISMALLFYNGSNIMEKHLANQESNSDDTEETKK